MTRSIRPTATKPKRVRSFEEIEHLSLQLFVLQNLAETEQRTNTAQQLDVIRQVLAWCIHEPDGEQLTAWLHTVKKKLRTLDD